MLYLIANTRPFSSALKHLHLTSIESLIDLLRYYNLRNFQLLCRLRTNFVFHDSNNKSLLLLLQIGYDGPNNVIIITATYFNYLLKRSVAARLRGFYLVIFDFFLNFMLFVSTHLLQCPLIFHAPEGVVANVPQVAIVTQVKHSQTR